jgi:hypothetical protein
VAALVADPDLVDPAADQVTRRAPRTVLVVRAGQCILRGPSPAALQALVAGPPLARRALVLAPAPASVRLAPASVVPAV